MARAIEILLVYDSFIDADDNEFFLCRIKKKSIEEKEGYCFRLEDIPKEVLTAYKSSQQLVENVIHETICSNDKTKLNSCELKAKTFNSLRILRMLRINGQLLFNYL